jgi:hypothetical protein
MQDRFFVARKEYLLNITRKSSEYKIDSSLCIVAFELLLLYNYCRWQKFKFYAIIYYYILYYFILWLIDSYAIPSSLLSSGIVQYSIV